MLVHSHLSHLLTTHFALEFVSQATYTVSSPIFLVEIVGLYAA